MAELAKKLFGGFQLGRKLLTTGVGMAHKIRNVFHSAPVQSLIGSLPGSLKDNIHKAANIGGKLLSGAEAVQLKLQEAQPLIGAVQQAVARMEDGGMVKASGATKSVELARKSLTPEASQRLPGLVAVGGARNFAGLQNQSLGKGMSMASFPIGGNVVNPVSMSKPAMMF